jgi:hypothetical protein
MAVIASETATVDREESSQLLFGLCTVEEGLALV